MSIVFYVRETPSTPGSIRLPKISAPADALPVLTWLEAENQEYFIVLTIDGAGGLIKSRVVTMGLLNHSLVHPREVFAPAIEDRAAGIIVVHNHPSGSPDPSGQDLDITRQLQEAGTILGIKVMDHIIILGGGGFVSLRETGRM